MIEVLNAKQKNSVFSIIDRFDILSSILDVLDYSSLMLKLFDVRFFK